jgi:hypothetical protein
MARTDAFFALSSGRPEGTPYAQTVHDLGLLVLPSGRLEASDPFVSLGESLVVTVPAGAYPVRVTVADVSDEQDGSHLREAYLSVVLAEGVVARVEGLAPAGASDADEGEPDDELFHGVVVDAGTVAFADAEAVRTLMPEGDWYEDLFDDGKPTSWFARMDDPTHLRGGSANIVLPLASSGENVVLAHSGWGDGWYPVLGSYAADGTLLGVHIDLLVAGEQEDDEDAA